MLISDSAPVLPPPAAQHATVVVGPAMQASVKACTHHAYPLCNECCPVLSASMQISV